jgi:ribosome-binding ATPase
MDIGIIGLPASGKTALYQALTSARNAKGSFAPGARIDTMPAQIPDQRLVQLSAMESSKKTTYAQVNISDVTGLISGEGGRRETSAEILGKVRNFDLLLVALRQFSNTSVPHILGSIDAQRDLAEVESELLVGDLAIIEKRITKIRGQKARSKEDRAEDQAEIVVLEKLQAALEEGNPVRSVELSETDAHRLKHFPFLTDRQLLICLNVDEDRLNDPLPAFLEGRFCVVVAAATEGELCDLEEDERAEFIEALGITTGISERVMRAALTASGRATFFTIGPTESRAWLIRDQERAVEAAGKIHADIARGFIRAEVISIADFMAEGPWKNLKGTKLVREEGKEYPVSDGDIINIRFSA